MAVEVRAEGVSLDPWEAAIRTDAQALLERVSLADGELSVVVCDDPFIHGLNQTWRGVDGPTDVLSFAMNEGEDAELHPKLLGDIVISLDTASRQATELGHGLALEVRVLLVHGLLHLLGYDHVAPGDATEMAEAEGRLLAHLDARGLGLVGRALMDPAAAE